MRPAVHAALLALTCLPTGTRRACQLALLPRRTAVIRLAATPDPDPYGALGVASDATAAQIKQAYRRLALKNHPDVNKAADAEAAFARIAAAYTILSDPEKRAEYDSSWRYRNGARKGASSTAQRSSPSSRSTSSSSSRADRSRDSAGGGRGFDDAAERVRQWREANPTPEELGDSFGSIFRDLASAVAGGGDWLSLLELESSTDLETLLRSSDTSLLEEELESAGWVVSCLRRRIDALRDEAARAERDAAEFKGGSPRRGAMAADYRRALARDASRRRSQVRDAEQMLERAVRRERRVGTRLEFVRGERRGGGAGVRGVGGAGVRGVGVGSAYGSSRPPSARPGSSRPPSARPGSASSSRRARRPALPSVEEELRRMKQGIRKRD